VYLQVTGILAIRLVRQDVAVWSIEANKSRKKKRGKKSARRRSLGPAAADDSAANNKRIE
jgi:hypothetical protein